MESGNGLGFWNTMPTRRLSSYTSYFSYTSVLPRSTLPSTRQPSMRSFMRLRQRRSVDLPQPDGPMNAVTLPAGMSSVMSFRAWWSP